jgi:WD40 repeat protein
MLNRIAPPHHGQASQSAGRLRFQNLTAGVTVTVQKEFRSSSTDMQVEAAEDQYVPLSFFLTRIVEHIRVTQMCTHIRHLVHNHADQLSLELFNKDLLRLQMQLNISDFPPVILDHITSAYQELGSTLLQSRLRILKGHHRDFNLSLAFSPDSHLLASTSSKYSVQIWDTFIEGQQPRTINTVKSALISSLAFAPDGQHIAAALGDMTV